MTVSVPSALVFSYAGDGTTTAFSYPVKFWASSEIVVIRRVDDVDTTLTLTTDYTVTGAGNDAGGTVTFGTAPAADADIIIYRDVARTQTVDLADTARNNAEAVEDQLDRLTHNVQDLNERFGRAVKFQAGGTGTTLTPAAGKVIGWNSTGTALEPKVIADLGEETLPAVAASLIGRDADNGGFIAIEAFPLFPQFYSDYVGDGETDDILPLQTAINAVRDAGGGRVVITKNTAVSVRPIIYSNTTLEIAEGATLKLIAASSVGLTIDDDAENVRIVGPGTLDCNHLASTYGIFGRGLKDCHIGGGLKIINWKRGVSLFSNSATGTPLVRPVVDGVVLTNPSTSNGVQFPILLASQIGGPWVLDASIRNCVVVGREGGHGASDIYTADQITAQGWLGGEILDNISLYGGENAMTIARISRNVRVRGNFCRFADAHGINIGSGYTGATVADTSSFVILDIGASATMTLSGASSSTATLTINPAPATAPVQNKTIFIFGSLNAQNDGVWTVTGVPTVGATWSATVTRASGNAVNETLPAACRVKTAVTGSASGTTGYLATKSSAATTYDYDGETITVVPANTLFVESTVGFWTTGENVTDGIATSALSARIINSAEVDGNTCLDNRLATVGTPSVMAEIYWQQAIGTCFDNNVGKQGRSNTNGSAFRDANSDVQYRGNTVLGGLTELVSSAPQRVTELGFGMTSNFAGQRGPALTIASGVITPTTMIHRVSPEAGTTDDLTAINGGRDGQLLLLYPNGAGNIITIKNGATIKTRFGRNIYLTGVDDVMLFQYSSARTAWQEVGVQIPAGIHQRPMRGVASVRYGADGKSVTGNQVMTANVLMMTPITLVDPVDITKISIEVTTGSAGLCRVGIYSDDGTNHPGALLIDGGGLDTTSTGTIVATVASQRLHGRYWLAAVFNATPTVNGLGTSVGAANGHVAGTTSAAILGYERSFTYGALPATEAGETYTAVTATRVPCLLLGA